MAIPTSTEPDEVFPAAPEPSDEALLHGIRAEHSPALTQLYSRYKLLLHKVVAPILPNKADAEETIQDVFAEIWNRSDRCDTGKGQPLGWIICMARRRAIDHLRKICLRTRATERLGAEEILDTEAAMYPQNTAASGAAWCGRDLGHGGSDVPPKHCRQRRRPDGGY